jgi:hypothetical protein
VNLPDENHLIIYTHLCLLLLEPKTAKELL